MSKIRKDPSERTISKRKQMIQRKKQVTKCSKTKRKNEGTFSIREETGERNRSLIERSYAFNG